MNFEVLGHRKQDPLDPGIANLEGRTLHSYTSLKNQPITLLLTAQVNL